LRLLGVGVSELAGQMQPDLFSPAESVRNQQLDQAVDGIRERFGKRAVAPASSLARPSDPLAGPRRPR